MSEIHFKKKVVLNKCFGGFSLSTQALKLFWRKKGFEIFPYGTIENNIVPTQEDKALFWLKIKPEDLEKELTSTKTKADRVQRTFYIFEKYQCENIKRDDHDLIEIVETLGVKANGSCSSLEVVELDICLQIFSYDGIESMADEK